MSNNNGSTEWHRVRFTLPVGDILIKWAKLESRSVPSLIQDLTVEGIASRIEHKTRPDLKTKIIHGEVKV